MAAITARAVLANPKEAITSGIATAWLRLRRINMGGVALCVGWPPIVFTGGDVRLGKNVRFRSRLGRMELGAEAGGILIVGDETAFGSLVSVVAHHRITIGHHCRFGDMVGVYDTAHHPVDSESPIRTGPVAIGDNVWIGRGALILPGVSIGNNSVVSAGAIVRKDVPPNILVSGDPAAPVRQLSVRPGWIRPGPEYTKKLTDRR